MMFSQSKGSVRIRPSDRRLAFVLGLIDGVMRTRLRVWRLRRLILKGEFDFIHLLETQHAGYMYGLAAAPLSRRPVTVLSLWGSDLVWFEKSSLHRNQIRRLLGMVDVLFSECSRDQEIARRLDFNGRMTKRLPASGGVNVLSDLESTRKLERPSRRRSLAVKGYTGFVGRARTALRAVVANADLLRGYDIHVYSVSTRLLPYLHLLSVWHSLKLVGHRKKSLSHEQMMKIFRSSRVSLSVSLSDGFPGSAREAAWAGAFPIESKGACIADWLHSPESYLLVDPEDESSVASALRIALLDDRLVDRASELNIQFARSFSSDIVSGIALDEYSNILAHVRNRDSRSC